jgi:hypothetical protein
LRESAVLAAFVSAWRRFHVPGMPREIIRRNLIARGHRTPELERIVALLERKESRHG